MDESYPIEQLAEPDWMIGRKLSSFNDRFAGDDRYQRLCFAARGPRNELYAGVIGEVYYGWLHVELMWVDESLRGKGYGSRLLAMVEEAARAIGARHAFLDTFTFQAPAFYQKYGYRIFGELADFPPGFTRYYLTKDL